MKFLCAKNKNHIFFITILIIFLSQSFSQAKGNVPLQTPLNETFFSVIPGDATSEPIATTFGFIVVVDTRTLVAINPNGVLLWQKRLLGKATSFITVTSDDFIYVVTQSAQSDNNSTLAMYNPSGGFLWSTEINKKVTQKPLQGDDGRIFIHTKTSTICYGLNGICRWEIETVESNLPILSLNDGSILLIQSETVYNNILLTQTSFSLRLSPYGEILEKITLSGIVKDCIEIEDGIVILFDDDSIGCISVKNNSAFSLWKFSEDKNNKMKFLVAINQKKDFMAITSNNLFLYKTKNNENKTQPELVSKIFLNEIINQNNLFIEKNNIQLSMNQKQIVLFQNQKDKIYSSCWNNYGTLIWKAIFSRESAYKFPIYMQNSGCVLFFGTDWMIYGFKVMQSENKQSLTKISSRKLRYLYNPENLQKGGLTLDYPTNINIIQIQNDFQKGYIGLREKEHNKILSSWINEIQKTLTSSTKNSWDVPTFFENNITRTSLIIQTVGKTGISTYSEKIAWLIENESDFSLLNQLIITAGQIGYDPTGKLLDALEKRTKLSTYFSSNIVFAKSICDSVYSICLYMGKKAFYDKGKSIISTFINPQYDIQIQQYSRDILNKIMKI